MPNINDVYQIEPRHGKRGFAPLMTLLKRGRAASSHTITTFGGDLFSPSIMSGLTKGAQMVEMMNAIGGDIAVVGNHEYDFGPEAAARNFAGSTFPWMGTNVLGPGGTPAGGLIASRIIEKGGFRIGRLLIALLLEHWELLKAPLLHLSSFASAIARGKTTGVL